jgi:hypothetical protein
MTEILITGLTLHQIISRSQRFGLLVTALAFSCAACGQSREVLVAFQTEQRAQEHCPNDTVVWVDLQSGGYHLKGRASHGGANGGRYACRGEAERVGMREIAN